MNNICIIHNIKKLACGDNFITEQDRQDRSVRSRDHMEEILTTDSVENFQIYKNPRVLNKGSNNKPNMGHGIGVIFGWQLIDSEFEEKYQNLTADQKEYFEKKFKKEYDYNEDQCLYVVLKYIHGEDYTSAISYEVGPKGDGTYEFYCTVDSSDNEGWLNIGTKPEGYEEQIEWFKKHLFDIDADMYCAETSGYW